MNGRETMNRGTDGEFVAAMGGARSRFEVTTVKYEAQLGEACAPFPRKRFPFDPEGHDLEQCSGGEITHGLSRDGSKRASVMVSTSEDGQDRSGPGIASSSVSSIQVARTRKPNFDLFSTLWRCIRPPLPPEQESASSSLAMTIQVATDAQF